MLLVLLACNIGLTRFNPSAEETPGVGEEPGRGDPPSLAPVDAWRNTDWVAISGLAAPGDDRVTLVITTADGSEEKELEVADDESFGTTVWLERGVPTEVIARNDNGESAPVVTEACTPWDSYEIAESKPDYGDTCDTSPVVVSEGLADNDSRVTVSGNSLEDGDVDWYKLRALDEPVTENSAGIETFNLEISFLEGAEAYTFQVYRGTCDSPECPESSEYEEYSFYAEDLEADEGGYTPEDPQACGTGLNECADFSGDWWVKVWRVDGKVDCTGYTLEIRNGA